MAQQHLDPVSADSPADGAQSPLPVGLQGELELELIGLANSLYNLGTTVVNDSTKEKAMVRPGSLDSGGGKPVGQRVNDVIKHLAAIDEMAEGLKTLVPLEVLQEIDNGKNPMVTTKDRFERAATENQFMNGKIRAIETYRSYLNSSLKQHFPDLAPFLEGGEGGSIEPSDSQMTIKDES